MLLTSRYGTISSTGAAQVKAVVAGATGAAWTTDGTNWNHVSFGTNLNQPTGGWINDDFVLFAGNSTDEGRLSIDDGATYSDKNIFTAVQVAGYQDIGDDGAGTVAVSSVTSPFYNVWTVAYTTDNGSTWTLDDPLGGAPSNANCWRILYDGTQWITAGSNSSGQRVQTKTTLGTGSWTGKTTPFSDCRGFDYDGSTYIFGVNQTSVYTTTDLTTYTARSVGANTSFIAYGNGVWLAAGTNIYKSTNSGVSWSLAYTAPSTVRRMKWSQSLGLFIVTTNSGNVFTSPDGGTWTTTNVGTTDTLYGIATR